MNALKNRTVAVGAVLLMCLTMFAGVCAVSEESDAEESPLVLMAGQYKFFTYEEIGLAGDQVQNLKANAAYDCARLFDYYSTPQYNITTGTDETFIYVTAHYEDTGVSLKVPDNTKAGTYTLGLHYKSGSDYILVKTRSITITNEHDGTSPSTPAFKLTAMIGAPVSGGSYTWEETYYVERGSQVSLTCYGTSTASNSISNPNSGLGHTQGALFMPPGVSGTLQQDTTVSLLNGKFVYHLYAVDPHYDVWSCPEAEYTFAHNSPDGEDSNKTRNIQVPSVLKVDIAVNGALGSYQTVGTDTYQTTGLTITPVHTSSGETFHITGVYSTGQHMRLSFTPKTDSMNLHIIEVTAYEPPTATYTLTYDANGGSGSMDNTVVSVIGGSGSVSVALAANGFTKNGYSFVGWKVGNQILQPGQTVTVSKDGTVNAVAQWSQNILNVSAGDISAVSNLSYGNQISASASNGATLSYAVKSCTGGTASVNTGGTVTYKAPTVNATASYTVTVTVTATFADSSTISKDVSFSVTVDPVLSFTNAATSGTLSVKGA